MTDAGRRRFLAQAGGAATAAAAGPLLTACQPVAGEPFPGVEGRWVSETLDAGHRVRAATESDPAPATAARTGSAPAGASGAGATASAPPHFRMALPPTDGSGPRVRERRCDVLIIGGGIAGLAAARALRMAGIEDIAIVELADTPGGMSRGHSIHGQGCPLGAHYLPLPGPAADEVRAFLFEAGLARLGPAGLRWDEHALCHSPQERLFIDGHWQEGLLPQVARSSPTQAQYQRFAAAITEAGRLGFDLPSRRRPFTDGHRALDAQTFAAWLDAQGLTDPLLRTYLDYCCRDDYGAGAGTVSAWAGVHYFASRHGFTAPGDDPVGAAARPDADGVLTWPEGNAHLARVLQAPLAGRVHTGRGVFRVEPGRDDVQAWVFLDERAAREPLPGMASVDAQRAEDPERRHGRDDDPGRGPRPAPAAPASASASASASAPASAASIGAGGAASPPPALERWTARHVILATPLFVSARLLEGAPDALRELAQRQRHAPWLVANLWLDALPADRVGVPLAWDNVIHGSSGLGYVNAQHQQLGPVTGPRLLTAYRSFPDVERSRLMRMGWQGATRLILDELRTVHPDLEQHLKEVHLARHGHGMAIPTPGLRSSAALAALQPDGAAMGALPRVSLAHADLAAYSVFEEAFGIGLQAGARAARQLRA